MQEKQQQKLSMAEKFAYAMGDCGANVYVAVTSTFLTALYTDTAGIAAAAVGTMMLVTRVFDGGSDLIMGAVVDKTKTRWGKARPWLLWSAPLMAIGFILLMNIPSGFSSGGKLVYAYVTYIFMNCIVYTMNNLPYNALLSRMTLDVQDRASASSIRFFMTQLLTLILNAVTANLVSSVGWFTLSIVYSIIMALMLVLCFLGTKEHVGEDADSGNVKVEKVPLKVALPALLKNRYFFIEALMFCVLYIGIVGSGTLGYYYCNIILNDVTLVTFVSMGTTIPAMITNIAVPKLVSRFGKWKLMITGCILMLVGSLVIGVANTNFALVVIGLVIKGFGMGPIMSGIFAMAADVVDYGEWKTGIRSEGLVNSCTSFGMKVGIGLGSAVATGVLSLGKYDGTLAVQPDSAVSAIRFGFGNMGAIIAVVLLILCILMNIDKYIDDIQRDLTAKHAS
ncbi:MAG: glycoside-pentoside-hexuronide (GPH):cation symporter [Clostridiales bacterium]|nr:glycoside-pentoside-hexuronide (GPH):cation symporter [Clostridiales bacterium]MCC8098593.1 glycoside-pentoside-hexuronide (GPH):cation symporter [Clostridiales bacterium]